LFGLNNLTKKGKMIKVALIISMAITV